MEKESLLYIIVVGPAPKADRSVIEATVRALDMEVCFRDDIHDTALAPARGTPAGYLSYLPCSRAGIVDAFSSFPVGAGQDIPFYQHLDEKEIPPGMAALPVSGFFHSPLTAVQAHGMAGCMARLSILLSQNHSLVKEVARYRKERNQLIAIGTSLSSEKYLDKLLALILSETRDVVGADAGSIYVREHVPSGDLWTNRLLFKVAQNDSVNMTEKAKEIPIPITDNTISGYVALMGEPLLIDDVYKLDTLVPYSWSKGFDKRFNYRTKSMLTVPLKNMAGEVVGVLQLMNKKKDPRQKLGSPAAISQNVAPFSHSDEDFVRSIGSFAAVSIERVQLYQEIEDIFEGFLSSSAAAIDERDRVTSGHSLRVAEYAMALVDAINAETEGPFGSINFSEERKRQFKFAAYLHDIGKIGVPEALLTKESKLSDASLVALESRGDYIKTMISWKGAGADLPWKSVQELDDDVAFIRSISKAGFLPDDGVKRLEALRAKRFRPAGGEPRALCSDAEWEQLSIRKGNLTDKERDLINSHAVATRRILTKIPWTRELREIPYIASHHHEKLDGSGYPDRLKESDINLECRILAVVDIYEALVSQDRPYKPRMPVAKAVEILRSEAKARRLDAGVVEFFVAKGIHQLFVKE